MYAFLEGGRRFLASGAILTACLVANGCSGGGGGSNSAGPSPPPAASEMSKLAQLGEKIFQDESLSASARMSCATCHDQAHAFAGATTDAVPFGGHSLSDAGRRNAPSLKYLEENPAFHFDDGTPTGGFNRDGRAIDLADQARRPFVTSFEMANTSPADVVAKLSRASYVADFQQIFGAQIFGDADQAFLAARQAIQAYEREDGDFNPFTSKYDYFLAGKAKLTEQELHGFALFNNPEKANCAGCHPSGRRAGGLPPLFTDFTYDNLGVPRNTDIPANRDPTYFDLGLCGPERTDLADRSDLCGAFKVPTLRNIAITAPYFHNGKFQTLREVLGFYVRRDTNPEEWYSPDGSGVPQKFNDLPAQFRGNVNTTEVPYNRTLGDQPALSPAEIEDVIAFLETLTDGYPP